MAGALGRGQGEDQPAVARVDRAEAEHVAKEGACPLGVVGEDDGVGSLGRRRRGPAGAHRAPGRASSGIDRSG